VNHLDLFSGIGGFSLAADWVWENDHKIIGFCEIDKFCQKVLKKHWPGVPIYDDIKKLDGKQFGTVDLLTGGFPCQPYRRGVMKMQMWMKSNCGYQKGAGFWKTFGIFKESEVNLG